MYPLHVLNMLEHTFNIEECLHSSLMLLLCRNRITTGWLSIIIALDGRERVVQEKEAEGHKIYGEMAKC